MNEWIPVSETSRRPAPGQLIVVSSTVNGEAFIEVERYQDGDFEDNADGPTSAQHWLSIPPPPR